MVVFIGTNESVGGSRWSNTKKGCYNEMRRIEYVFPGHLIGCKISPAANFIIQKGSWLFEVVKSENDERGK